MEHTLISSTHLHICVHVHAKRRGSINGGVCLVWRSVSLVAQLALILDLFIRFICLKYRSLCGSLWKMGYLENSVVSDLTYVYLWGICVH